MSEITLRDIYHEIKDLHKEMDRVRESMVRIELKFDDLRARVDQHEKEIQNIKESLVGNVTAKTLKAWVIGSASVMAAISALLGMLLKILN